MNDYFDKIFVITLDRAKDRQENIKKLLEGVSYEFFWGADKHHLDLATVKNDGLYDEVKAKQMNRHGKKMSLGEIACSLSHRNLYQYMLEQKYQRVLILEDDVQPMIENFENIQSAFNDLPSDWDLIYLGYNKHEVITDRLKRKQLFYLLKSKLGLMKWTPSMIKNFLPKPFTENLRIAGFHDCTHAYAVTLHGAEKLLRNQQPVIFPADDLISYSIMSGEVKAYVTMPKFFDQELFTNPGQFSFVNH